MEQFFTTCSCLQKPQKTRNLSRDMTIESKDQPTLREVEFHIKELDEERLEITDELVASLENISGILDKKLGHQFEESIKGAMWMKMDIVRIVQFHAQLRYDTEITAMTGDAVDEEGNKTSKVMFGVVQHTYLAPEDLIEKKLGLLDDDDKKVLRDRHLNKATAKVAELRNESRDFGHLFKKIPEETLPGIPVSNTDPVVKYLGAISEFEAHDWIGVLNDLRAIIFSVNSKELERLQITGEAKVI